MLNRFILLLLLEFFISIPAVSRQDTCSLFRDSDSVLHVKITTTFDSLLNQTEETNFFPAVLNWSMNNLAYDGTIPVLVRNRGNFRRKSGNCDFPPLKLKFEKEIRENTCFAPYKSLKMVTHCKSGERDFDQHVLKEYLVYRIYSILAEYSYKVQLAEITYADANENMKEITRYGFFIENNNHLEERLNGKIIDSKKGTAGNMNQDTYLKLAFFQYMIINIDWSVEIYHNVRFFFNDPLEPPHPVPFDFDFAGIVGIPYRLPNARGTDRHAPRRTFKPDIPSRKKILPVIDFYNSRKAEILELVHGFELLKPEDKKQFTRDIEEFYYIINDRKSLRNNILKRKYILF